MFRECLEMDDEEVSFIVAADEVGDLFCEVLSVRSGQGRNDLIAVIEGQFL